MAMTLRSFQTSPIPAKEGLERRDTPAAPISQVLFEGALLRERQRADRCNDPLLLLEVASDDAILISESHWDAVASSIAAATRETDVRGWIRPRAALGVILTENRVANTALVGQLERRIRCELGQDVDTATAGTLSVRLHVYPDSGVPESPGSAAAEGTNEIVRLLPLLEDIRLRSFQQPIYEVVKRAVDIVGSISLLAVLSPLLLLIAAAIRFRSPGPALFQQVRIGREGRSFTMLKFRTMRLDADHGIHQAYVADFIDNVTRISAGKAIKVFKILDDPRVTRLGRLLRRTSLDELPQLWNVVRGDMSLVGPRPPLPYEVAQYKSWHLRRVLESKPGITGLWQVTGRSRTTFDEMVRLDLRYARTRSLWTDLKILLATPRAVIDGKGAH